MIVLKKVRQTPDMCGPACLVSLLDFYGIQKTEAELATLCNSTHEYGTPPESLVQALTALGFTVHATEGGTWEQLKQLTENNIPVLVNWWSDFLEPADGHYSIAYNVTDEAIHVMDPEIGDYREVPKEKFLANWHDFIGATKKPVHQWFLYITKNPE